MKTYLDKKNKQLKKTIPQHQTETEERIQTIQKGKKFLPYILALFFGLLFTSHKFFDTYSQEFKEAKTVYQKDIDKVTAALNVVKKEAEGTLAYQNYLKARDAKDVSKKKYFAIKKEEKVYGFKSFHFWVERFSMFLGFFIYALINLFRSYYFERNNVGMKFLHGSIIAVCMFYFFWIFQKYQDYSDVTYYLITVLFAGGIVLAVSLITKYQKHYINTLKFKYLNLVKFTFINTKPEKKQEMLDLLEQNEVN